MEWELRAEFRVLGTPVPQGSKKVIPMGRWVLRAGKRWFRAALRPDGMPITSLLNSNDEKLKPWRAEVKRVATEAWGSRRPLDESVRVDLEFRMPRLASHYGTGKNRMRLKPAAPDRVTVKPDVDKLERAVLDALTDAGVLKDDARVNAGWKEKLYGVSPGVRVRVYTAPRRCGECGGRTWIGAPWDDTRCRCPEQSFHDPGLPGLF